MTLRASTGCKSDYSCNPGSERRNESATATAPKMPECKGRNPQPMSDVQAVVAASHAVCRTPSQG